MKVRNAIYRTPYTYLKMTRFFYQLAPPTEDSAEMTEAQQRDIKQNFNPGKRSPNGMYVCNACGFASYWYKTCQRLHWFGHHKAECNRLKL